ncbi:hypothetical protein HHI36_014727 [Cryptolaemus montrouzieri]|uniref:Amidase domain-containing protein n=1 Tax=Cryptolaemus montrouzieri TaxID=559131 RepID=A0ABD2N3K9_9CUCU
MSSFKIYQRAFIRVLFSVLDVAFHFIFRIIYGPKGKKAPPITDLLLLDSASKIAFKIRTKKVKCVDVLESFIARIEQINPLLNCVVADRFEEAREEAKKVDELLNSGSTSEVVLSRDKPFLGVPFTTKDCIAVKGMINTSGLVSRKNIIAVEDAPAITCLKNAGAIPIALTNIPECCMWWDTDNNVHGRCRNPYDTNRIVGGSSGGEGCIQASAGSAFGLGSDIGGSIRMPAFFNGIFGHKPSPHIVSNDGQYPPSASANQESFLGVGPMCRHAEDLLPLLKVVAGKNASKLQLDEDVRIADIDIFYQEDDQGSPIVSPVNREIKALFGKLVTYFNKAHTKKINKLELKEFSKSFIMWSAGMKTENGPTLLNQLANLNGSLNVPLEFLKWCFRLSDHTLIALVVGVLIGNDGIKVGQPIYTNLMHKKEELKEKLLGLLGNILLYTGCPREMGH